MMKYPIGIQSFNQMIEDGYVYVDKTELIYQLVKNGFVSLVAADYLKPKENVNS